MKNALATVLCLAAFGCGSAKEEKPSTAKATGIGDHIVPVEVATTMKRDISVSKSYSGTLEGEEQANIVAKIPERITGVNVHVGEVARAGQVLITLDKSGSSSQYYQAMASFNNAEKTLARMKSLYSEGAISLQTLDGTQTAYDVARANFEAARSTVELTTPISGVVTAVNVSVGELASPGAVLVTAARINRLKVIFSINETDATNLSVGQKVLVYSETRPNEKVEGRIFQLSKSADLRSRSFEIKAMFSNTRDKWFRPGMFCKVDVNVSPRKQTLVIPNVAIQSDGSENWVYLLRNGRAFRREVHVGVSDGQNSEILLGLAERDTVATVGVTTLKDSGFVRVVNRPH